MSLILIFGFSYRLLLKEAFTFRSIYLHQIRESAVGIEIR